MSYHERERHGAAVIAYLDQSGKDKIEVLANAAGVSTSCYLRHVLGEHLAFMDPAARVFRPNGSNAVTDMRELLRNPPDPDGISGRKRIQR